MKKSKEMKYHFAIKGRIYPNDTAKRIIYINDAIYRKVYNILVAANKEKHELKSFEDIVPAYKGRITFLDEMTSSAKTIKNMHPYMNGELVDSDVVNNAISNYKDSWNMYKKVPTSGTPTFHKRSYELSYNTSAHYKKRPKWHTPRFYSLCEYE